MNISKWMGAGSGVLIFVIVFIIVTFHPLAHISHKQAAKNLTDYYLLHRESLPNHFTACIPETAEFCDEAGNCAYSDPTVFVLLSGGMKDAQYHRCNERGCDSYDSIYSISGAFENVQTTEPQGVLLKRALGTPFHNEYFEIVSIGLGVGMNRGKCIDSPAHDSSRLLR